MIDIFDNTKKFAFENHVFINYVLILIRFNLVRKAYHRMSLQIHPDRVIESEKEEATEKFKLLKEIIVVLTNPSKKAIYDEQGIICDEGETECHWPEFFNQIIIKENENFHKCYSGMLM